MAIVTVSKNSYTVDPLYQWDLNQTLEVHGLSLATTPEVHFCHQDMGAAIVRQATMDAAGVIYADIPNSLLQKPYKLQAYICVYEGSTFKTLYKIEVPVKARNKPADYTLEDDPEVYSFNALENQVVNALARMDTETAAAKNAYSQATQKLNTATSEMQTAKTAYENAKSDVGEAVEEAVDTAMDSIPTLTADEIAVICV